MTRSDRRSARRAPAAARRFSVVVLALRTPNLNEVRVADYLVALRLVADRRDELFRATMSLRGGW